MNDVKEDINKMNKDLLGLKNTLTSVANLDVKRIIEKSQIVERSIIDTRTKNFQSN